MWAKHPDPSREKRGGNTYFVFKPNPTTGEQESRNNVSVGPSFRVSGDILAEKDRMYHNFEETIVK